MGKLGTFLFGLVFMLGIFGLLGMFGSPGSGSEASVAPTPTAFLTKEMIVQNAVLTNAAYQKSISVTSLPNIEGKTLALVYGKPKSIKWGSLGKTNTPAEAIEMTLWFASQVDQWNGAKGTVSVVNPNIAPEMYDSAYVDDLISQARGQGVYVMLDVQTAMADHAAVFDKLFDRYLAENVWFDFDIEMAGKIDSALINKIAESFFRKRAEKGFTQSGVFAVYVWELDAMTNIQNLQRDYKNGVVIPIFDGRGPEGPKVSQTERFKVLYGHPYGIMEFDSNWGARYGEMPANSYFGRFPDALIFARN